MWDYGETWLFDSPAAIELYDKRTGAAIRPGVIDRSTGEPLDLTTTRRRVRAGAEQKAG